MSMHAALLYCVPPIVGVAVGYLLGGRLRQLAGLRLRALWLLWPAAAGQLLALRLLTGVPAAVAVVAAFGAASACLAVNLRDSRPVAVTGSVVLAGAALNAVAMVLNGGMPYSPAAAARAGGTAVADTVKNAAAQPGTRLLPLGDVIAVPPLHAVVSVGDLLITVGIAALVATSMHRHTPAPVASRPDESPASPALVAELGGR
jgi:hypothetical protein